MRTTQGSARSSVETRAGGTLSVTDSFPIYRWAFHDDRTRHLWPPWRFSTWYFISLCQADMSVRQIADFMVFACLGRLVFVLDAGQGNVAGG
jgi:hypothetical protein